MKTPDNNNETGNIRIPYRRLRSIWSNEGQWRCRHGREAEIFLTELEQRIKYAVAKELIEMGYMAGVTVPRCDGGFINVQGKKGEEFVNVEIQVVDAEAVKLRILTEVFNGLSGRDENPVEEMNLINELVKTERFTREEARTYISKAMHKGRLYESKPGFYART